MAADVATPVERRYEAPAPIRRRQPVYVLCSPRSRVGRTLTARLLVEYALSDGRRALGFDVNPDDRSFSRHLPLNALPASLNDSRGHVALFDRLIINDGAVKVVDLGADQFNAFFDITQQIAFNSEAKARGIETVILFFVGDDRRSEAAYRRLLMRRDHLVVVPVENPAIVTPPGLTSPPLPHTEPPLVLPVLPEAFRAFADRADFSFGDCLKRMGEQTELAGWVGRMFFAFRDLERRLHMADAAAAYGLPPALSGFAN